MANLEIVWRNPDEVRRHPRRHTPLEKGRTLYILQEFVGNDDLGYWTTISELEVLAGGLAA
jgi:hypothetical protein